MPNSIPKVPIAIGVAAVVIAAGAVVMWFAPDGEDTDESPVELDAAPPAGIADGWEADEPDRQVYVDAQHPPRWTSDAEQPLLEGPVFEGLDIEFQHATRDGWSVLVGQTDQEGVELRIHIWAAPGFPTVIVDYDATVTGSALVEPLVASAEVTAQQADILSARLERQLGDDPLDEVPMLAGRFATEGPTLQLGTDPGTSALVSHTGGDHYHIEWRLWAGLDDGDVADCLDDETARDVSGRLVFSFGDHPTVGALATPPQARSLSIPVIVDPPARSDNPLEDGRASDAEDFARRLRALAFGHSDRDDPRFGNGGLLAHDMGAVFAVPARWWEDPAVERLRASLDQTQIDVVPAGDAEVAGDGPVFVDQQPTCANIGDFSEGEHTDFPRWILAGDGDVPSSAPLTAATEPIAEIGRSSTDRDEVLSWLFGLDDPGGLFVPGERRSAAIPLVATRNPLEEIADHQILEPDRSGHWKLGDALTRQFIERQFEPRAKHFLSASFDAVGPRDKMTRNGPVHWAPDGVLQRPEDGPETLFFFGNLDGLDVDADTTDPAATWRYDPTALPTTDDTPPVVDVVLQ